MRILQLSVIERHEAICFLRECRDSWRKFDNVPLEGAEEPLRGPGRTQVIAWLGDGNKVATGYAKTIEVATGYAKTIGSGGLENLERGFHRAVKKLGCSFLHLCSSQRDCTFEDNICDC